MKEAQHQPAETIVTVLTSPGRSALATLAIHGADAHRIAHTLFTPARGKLDLVSDPGPYYGTFGHDPSDDVVLAETSNGRGPTIEVHCHGGPAMVAALLRQVERAGARAVDWRETRHRQGLSLIQIEATEALAQCRTQRAAAVLLDQANGALDEAIERITSNNDLQLAGELLSWKDFGLHLVEPWKVLLIGPPNVGKSSLLNALVGHDRAIVSPTAGTTRDVIQGETSINGWPFVISDGAGLRQTEDEIERAGILLLERAMKTADLCLVVHDLSIPYGQIGIASVTHRNCLMIGNKNDLTSPWTNEERNGLDVTVCAKTGHGIEELLGLIVSRLIPIVPVSAAPIPFTRRQIEFLTTLLESR